MRSSLVGKVEKARRYSEERGRIELRELALTFHGEHNGHLLAFLDEPWRCNCDFFSGWGTYSHVMAMERILGGMLPTAAAVGEGSP